MKCNNPNENCPGEMKPLTGAPNFIECVTCGWRQANPERYAEGGIVIGEGSAPDPLITQGSVLPVSKTNKTKGANN